MEQNNSMRFHLLNFCTVLGQLLYHRLCPVHNRSISLYLVLWVQHGHEGARHTRPCILLVLEISSWFDRLWLIYHCCVPNDSFDFWILSIENGYCKQGDKVSKDSSRAHRLFALADGELR
jgi:hypothetical protein